MAADGAVTGQVVQQTVNYDDECVSLSDVWNGTNQLVCDLGDVSNYYDGACQHGDGGGPTYQRADGGVYAAGVILGGDDEANGDCHRQEMEFLLPEIPGMTLLNR